LITYNLGQQIISRRNFDTRKNPTFW